MTEPGLGTRIDVSFAFMHSACSEAPGSTSSRHVWWIHGINRSRSWNYTLTNPGPCPWAIVYLFIYLFMYLTGTMQSNIQLQAAVMHTEFIAGVHSQLQSLVELFHNSSTIKSIHQLKRPDHTIQWLHNPTLHLYDIKHSLTQYTHYLQMSTVLFFL